MFIVIAYLWGLYHGVRAFFRACPQTDQPFDGGGGQMPEEGAASRAMFPYRDFPTARLEHLETENRELREEVELMRLETAIKDQTIAEFRRMVRIGFLTPWLAYGLCAMAVFAGFSFAARDPASESRGQMESPASIPEPAMGSSGGFRDAGSDLWHRDGDFAPPPMSRTEISGSRALPQSSALYDWPFRQMAKTVPSLASLGILKPLYRRPVYVDR